MTIKEAQQQVDEWIQKYGVRYFSELTNMAILTEEALRKNINKKTLRDSDRHLENPKIQ